MYMMFISHGEGGTQFYETAAVVPVTRPGARSALACGTLTAERAPCGVSASLVQTSGVGTSADLASPWLLRVRVAATSLSLMSPGSILKTLP